MSDNQIFNQIGREITEALSESLMNGDFSNLNNAISNSVNRVLDEATEHLEKGGSGQRVNSSNHSYSTYSNGSATRQKQLQLQREREEFLKKQAKEQELRRDRARQEQERREKTRQRIELSRRMKSPNAIISNGKLLKTRFLAVGDNTSIFKIIFGAIGDFIFGPSAIGFVLLSFSDASANLPKAIIISMLTIASTLLIVSGVRRRSLIRRAKRYATLCGEKMYAKIDQIALNSGTTKDRILKDISKIFQLGMYPEGHLDDERTTLMLSDSVYNEYIGVSESRRAQEEAAAEVELTNAEKSELELMMSEGMNAVSRLHELNDDIPGEVITKKLDCLENLLKQIFNRVKEHPEQMDRIHKLMDYYLPTMLKLVEAYSDYDKVTAPGDEIVNAKLEIENTLDTINEAFVQLLNNLFQDSVWDVTSDAQVLKTMLTQEGLTKEEELKNI